MSIPLIDIALLYVAAAVAPDGYLTDAEVQRIGETFSRRWTSDRATSMPTEVLAAMEALTEDAAAQAELVRNAATLLRDVLDRSNRLSVIDDLRAIARADGIVMERERTFIEWLSSAWGFDVPERGTDAESGASWTPLHDLALIYLVLAHGTDFELSTSERRLILRKLQEWSPDHAPEDVESVLQAAMNRYAEDTDSVRIGDSIRAVREALPAQQRMAALHDLIQIANADGIFLDTEEDLINRLLTEWEVDPFATYGRHGRKSDS